MQLKNNTGFIFSAIALTVFFLYYFFFGELLPVNNGLGFDGLIYAEFIKDIPSFLSKADTMTINRILPSIVIKIIFELLNIEPRPQNIVSAFQILNFLIIIAALYLWNDIVRSLDKPVALFSFIGLFLSFGILKFSFYYAPLTDTSAFFLSVLLLWAYMFNKTHVIFLVTITGIFTLPLLAIMSLTLYVFPNTAVTGSPENNKALKISGSMIGALLFTALAAFLIKGSPDYRGVSTGPVSPLMKSITIPSLIGTFLLFASGCYLLIASVNFKSIFSRIAERNSIKRILVAIVVLAGLVMFTRLIISHYHIKAARPFTNYFINILVTGNRYPLGNIISHLMYFGPLFLILILLWKSICKTAYSKSLGMYLILVQFFMYSFDAESRHIITYVPFLVYILVSVPGLLSRLTPAFITCFGVLALVLSKIPVSMSSFPTSDGLYNYALNTALLFDDRAFFWLLPMTLGLCSVFYLLLKKKRALS